MINLYYAGLLITGSLLITLHDPVITMSGGIFAIVGGAGLGAGLLRWLGY